MKTRYIFILAAAAAITVQAQILHVRNGSVVYSYPAPSAGKMLFSTSGDPALSIRGFAHPFTQSAAMWVDQAEVEQNVVGIAFSAGKAEVNIAGNLADYVVAEVEGAHVVIRQSADVSDSTCGEITYRLSGTAPDGSFSLEGSYKSSIELLGLDLANPSGAPLNIDNGKRISLSVKSGTVNSLSDGTGGDWKGCIVCKGHLELKGKGELTVSGNTSHAIYAKEYIEMKNCTVKIPRSAKDGINCNQYFIMESGNLEISGVADDGIQVSFKDDADREEEDTGSVSVIDGKITVEVTADAAKGIKCEGDMNISGGEIDVTVKGDGIWDSAKSKTKASACLASDGDMNITGGLFLLNATGGGGKGINADGDLNVGGGDIVITTSGGIVAYVNGTLSNNYAGNTDRLDSDMKSSPKGIKADGDITIDGGKIHVTTTGNGAEGIESKSVLAINDGEIFVSSTDDAINSSSHMYIKGGNVTVMASGNDGLDSNGNLYIQGGRIMAFGSGSPECGIDANEEQGYTVIFTGGTLLAAGGGNSVPSSSSGSTQPYVSCLAALQANSEVALTDASGEILASFTIPAEYKGASSPNPGFGGGGRPGGGSGSGTQVLVTCPGLISGTSYILKTDTASTNVTARLTGSSGGGWRP